MQYMQILYWMVFQSLVSAKILKTATEEGSDFTQGLWK